MSYIKIQSLKIKNYRSFGNKKQEFDFTKATDAGLPLAITGYNNAGKTNLMNAILYGIGYLFLSEKTFDLSDQHELKIDNSIEIVTDIIGSDYQSWSDYHGDYQTKSITGTYQASSYYQDEEIFSKCKPSFYGTNKHYQIFYINFHKIKDEISTQKSSWGNLKSFLAKHIKKLVDEDHIMKERKISFQETIGQATKTVLDGSHTDTSQSRLSSFIQKIKTNYNQNLRDNNCEVEFGLPDYEDIFLQMIFKIGLNGETDKLVPIDHFGDGYISMFVMAVIQAIAEEQEADQCLFLFEEPESFLHENHQEYFYNAVLKKLAKNGHQVIYTTHSDKMVDITEPDSLIRLRFDTEEKQTIKTFPDGGKNPLTKNTEIDLNDEKLPVEQYNQYIKTIEPNLNKILFSEKVILVEGPNDLLVYKYLIEQKARQRAEEDTKIKDKETWAKNFLNFENIAIVPHHGKATAYLLAELCSYLGVNYYLINDWDFEESDLRKTQLQSISNEVDLEQSDIYTNQPNSNRKGMVKTNWKLIKSAKDDQIHFNIKELESLIEYTSEDKDPLKIWQAMTEKYKEAGDIKDDIFPDTLTRFLFEKEIIAKEAGENFLEAKLPEAELPEVDMDSMNVEMPF